MLSGAGFSGPGGSLAGPEFAACRARVGAREGSEFDWLFRHFRAVMTERGAPTSVPCERAES